MYNIISKHFDLSENDVEAQALNEEVVASAATSEENVPTGEAQNESQASMPASGMSENDLKQDEVRAADCEARSSILAECTKQGAVKQEHFTVSLSNLMAMGYIIATFVMNREVNEKHVKRLMNDVRSQGKSAFSQYVTVCTALAALRRGYDVIGLDGKLVTLETPNLDKMLVIIDGQHRVAACFGTKLDIDCDVMIVPCPEDIAQDIKDRNCCDKNWDTTALRHQIVEIEKKQDVLAEYEKRAKDIYPGCSDKFYTTILTVGKKDAVRRSQVSRGELPACDVKKAEMGLELLRSLRQLNPDSNKNDSLTLKIVEPIMIKMNELAVADMTNGEFVRAFKVFASQFEMACDSKDGAEDFIANFSENFSSFIDQHNKIDEETIAGIDEHVEKIIAAGPAKIVKPASASLYEMIHRIKESEEATALKAAVAAEKAAKKAKKDAVKAAKKIAEQKAKETGKMVEDMALKAGIEIKDDSNI